MTQKTEVDKASGKECQTVFLLIADIKGFADLAGGAHLRCFFEQFHPTLFSVISAFDPLSSTSVGGTVCCVFSNPVSATSCALKVRDFCKEYDFDKLQLPRLPVRISLHSSRFYSSGTIPGDGAVIRAQVNLASRLEPILRPGEVWTCDTFVRYLEKAGRQDFASDNLGVKPLARKWGGQEIHRVRRKAELPFENQNIYEKFESKRLDPVAILLTLYERGDDEQQVNAVKMLGRKNDERAVEKLCSIAQDGNLPLLLRLEAIASLGRLKNSQAVPALATMLEFDEYEDPRIQIACIDSIVSIGDKGGETVVLSILKNMDAYQEAVSRRALKSLILYHNQTALDFAVELVVAEKLQGQLLKTALYVLAKMKNHKATSAAIKLLDKSNRDDIRYGALVYLVHGSPNCVKKKLQEIALDRKDFFELRVVALAGLAKIGSNKTKTIVAEIAEAAESLSSYAAQFLVEGRERVERFEKEALEDFVY
ncbi:MAG: HEAT repeat domain-containing protein [Desulfobulbaceae bacterium]|nr:HEAT repeat domain-containing protein [Desulfobulbaceae bacterium]